LRLSGSKLCKQWSGNAIDRKSLESAVLIKLSTSKIWVTRRFVATYVDVIYLSK